MALETINGEFRFQRFLFLIMILEDFVMRRKIKNKVTFNFCLSSYDRESIFVMAAAQRKSPSEFMRDLVREKYAEMNQGLIVNILSLKSQEVEENATQ